MNVNSFLSDMSEDCPNLNSKLPTQMKKSFQPSRASMKSIQSRNPKRLGSNIIEIPRLITSPVHKFSPLARKRRNPIENFRLRPSILERIVPNFTSLFRILKYVRLRKFYNSYENLKDYHYKIISDVTTDFNEDNNSKKNQYKSIWMIDTARSKNKDSKPKLTRKLTEFIVTTFQNQHPIRSLSAKLLYLIKAVPLIEPTLSLKLLWDWFIFLVIMWMLYIYSIEKCFYVHLFNHELLTKMYFFMVIALFTDILLTMNTTIYEAGKPVRNRAKIFLSYLKNTLPIDLIPTLGIFLYFLNLEENAYAELNLLLLLKLFFGKYNLINRTKELVIKENRHGEAVYDLICLAVKILLSAHIIACLWHLTSFNYMLKNPGGNSWIKDKEIHEESWNEKYLFSIYWSVTTMLTVGYGDITAKNYDEMIFNICAMFCGCVIFGYSMNSIGDILKRRSQYDIDFSEKVKCLNKMVRNLNLSNNLETKIKKYLEFVWDQEEKENPEQETLFMNKLSFSLKEEIFLETRVKSLRSVPIFSKTFSEKTLIKIASSMKKIRCSPEEFIFKPDSLEDNLYIILEGKVDSMSGFELSQNKETSWETFNKGDFFGIHEFITGLPRRNAAFTREYTTLYQITRSEFLEGIKKEPEEYEKFCNLRDSIILCNNHFPLMIKCGSCGRQDHRVFDCKFLKFEPDRLLVVKKYSHRKLKIPKRRVRKTGVKKYNALLNARNVEQSIQDLLNFNQDDQEIKDFLHFYTNDDDDNDKSADHSTSPSPTLIRNLGGTSLLPENEFINISDERGYKNEQLDNMTKVNGACNKQYDEKTEYRKDRSGSHRTIHSKKRNESLPPTITHESTSKAAISILNIDKLAYFRYYFPNGNVDKVLRRNHQIMIRRKIRNFNNPQTKTNI